MGFISEKVNGVHGQVLIPKKLPKQKQHNTTNALLVGTALGKRLDPRLLAAAPGKRRLGKRLGQRLGQRGGPPRAARMPGQEIKIK